MSDDRSPDYYDDAQEDWAPAAEWGYGADKLAVEYEWADRPVSGDRKEVKE